MQKTLHENWVLVFKVTLLSQIKELKNIAALFLSIIERQPVLFFQRPKNLNAGVDLKELFAFPLYVSKLFKFSFITFPFSLRSKSFRLTQNVLGVSAVSKK